MDADGPRVGKIIAGRYRVVERCEQGSAPFAFRAARLVDGVEVLLFVAPSSHLSPGGLSRFAERARLVRGLAEGRWMMVLDDGVDGDGAAYLVTSYWARETAEQRVLRQGGINIHVAVDVTLDALSALATLHDRDRVHGGLTPEDVLLVMGEDGALHGHVLAGGMLRALACGPRGDDGPLRAACAAPRAAPRGARRARGRRVGRGRAALPIAHRRAALPRRHRRGGDPRRGDARPAPPSTGASPRRSRA
jgi:hypothetical protein